MCVQGNPGKGGRIDVLKLMQDLSCGESSNTDVTTITTDMPNGLSTIQESDNDKNLDKSSHSPSSSGEMSTSHSKKSTHKSLASSKNPRRSSDTSVVKKPTPTKLRPSSVSSSKILSTKSPHSKKHT